MAVIREGKARQIVISTMVMEPVMIEDVDVKIHDTGMVDVSNARFDPLLEMTCHLINTDILWNFDDPEVLVPDTNSDATVTHLRRKKK